MRRNLFLYLAIACFVGLIAIFIVDGYLGVYDTVYITTGEQEQKIEPDEWLRQDRVWKQGVNVNWNEKVSFTYEVDNRRFSTYKADIEVSVWRMQEKVLDVTSQSIVVTPFGEGQVEWVIDTAELLPDDIPPEQSYEYTVIINRGEIERRIIVNVGPLAYPLKSVPVPSR